MFSYNTDARLYEALKKSFETERENLSDVDCRTLQLFLKDFEQSGVHLSYEKVCFIFMLFPELLV